MSVSIADLVPERGNWIGDFVEWADTGIMAPTEFKLGIALACVSAAVGRGVWFRLGRRRWTPHVWLVLMGPAAAKKSTPMALGGEFVRKIRGDEAFMGRRFTPEGLYRALAACPDPYWDLGELEGFLGGARRDYMSGIRSELADLWDGIRWSRTLAKETQSVDRPAVTVVAGSRPHDFEEAAGLADFRSGMLSRFVLLEATSPGEHVGLRVVEGYTDSIVDTFERQLHADLAEIAAWHGGEHQVHIDDQAADMWDHLDKTWQADVDTVSPELTGWAGRRGIQTLKIAVLHGLARKHQPIVEAEDMAWARFVVENSWDSVNRLSIEQIGLDRDAPRRERVYARAIQMALESSRKGQPLYERDLFRSVHRLVKGGRELDDILAYLIRTGELRKGWRNPSDEQGQGRGGRPAAVLWHTAAGDPPEGWTDR